MIQSSLSGSLSKFDLEIKTPRSIYYLLKVGLDLVLQKYPWDDGGSGEKEHVLKKLCYGLTGTGLQSQ